MFLEFSHSYVFVGWGIFLYFIPALDGSRTLHIAMRRKYHFHSILRSQKASICDIITLVYSTYILVSPSQSSHDRSLSFMKFDMSVPFLPLCELINLTTFFP